MIKFSSFLNLQEKVLSLSIGLANSQEHLRDRHKHEFHDIIQKSYSKIGGYGGHSSGSSEESKAIHDDIKTSIIKAVKRNGKITALNMYKDQHGRKSIASGTDGSDQGKLDWKKIKHDDHTQERAWGEVSGAAEKLQHKMGVPKIPVSKVSKLINKPIRPVDDHRYIRKIGGHDHEKVVMGHPKID